MSDDIELRAEVGLLSRNITIRGDEQYSKEQEFGAHVIIFHEGSLGQISDVEFFNTGQMGGKGRYTLHFHQVGDCSNCIARRNSMHHAFNRATTVHDTMYLT